MKESLWIRVKRWQFMLGLAVAVLLVALAAERTFTGGLALGRMGTAPRYVEAPKGELHRWKEQRAALRDSVARKVMGDWLYWVDSLQRDGSGRRLYDSIMRVRPGLVDSVKRAYEFYRHR